MTAIDFCVERPGYLGRILNLLARLVGQRQTRRCDQLPLDELMAWSPARLADLGIRPGEFGARGGVDLSNFRRSPWS